MTLGDGLFGDGTFGDPTYPIIIVHPDGTTEGSDGVLPHSYLPDGTGVRVRIHFVGADEDDPDYDVTCFLAGSSTTRGRRRLFDDIDAGTSELTLIDPLGIFDPRWKDTLFGPGRRVATGAWIRLEVWRDDSTPDKWIPLLTGLVDNWSRRITPDEDASVSVSSTDFFQGLAQAHVNGALAEATVTARIDALLSSFWKPTWGAQSVASAAELLYAEPASDDIVLSLMRAGAQVADGRVYVDADGTFVFENGIWRYGRSAKLLFLGRGAQAFTEDLTLCTYFAIAYGWANYDAVQTAFLTYDDMFICAGSGDRLPVVCGTTFVSEDDADDLVNSIVLEYKPAMVGDTQPPSVYYTSEDTASIAQYGERGYKRSDLTPVIPAMLSMLADTLVGRWSEGEATVTSASVDLLRDGGATTALLKLKPGDVVHCVDEIPETIESPERWYVTTAEVMFTRWSIGPTQFTVSIGLDQLRAGTAPALTEGVEDEQAERRTEHAGI